MNSIDKPRLTEKQLDMIEGQLKNSQIFPDSEKTNKSKHSSLNLPSMANDANKSNMNSPKRDETAAPTAPSTEV